MTLRLSFRFSLIFLLISSLSCEATQSVESRVDNHSLDHKEESIAPGNAKKSFLRSLQQANGCNYPCNKNDYCVALNGPCAYCVNNQCLSTTKPVCGTTCKTSSHCYGGEMGCNFCVNNKCATSTNPTTKCSTKCQGDFQCSGGGVCSRCINFYCQQPQCGTYCHDNTGCSNGAHGCTTCLPKGDGTSVCLHPPQCGSPCDNNNQCYSNNQGCTTCSSSGQCVNPSTISTACVGTFDALRSAASGTYDTITLCAGSRITLNAQLIVYRRGSFTLQCATVGSCTINGNDSYTNIVINAAYAVISGITFQHCKSSDNGGAIMINAVSQQGSRIESCTFNGNSAMGNGGAVYVNGGYVNVINCFGSSNWANQCYTIYQTGPWGVRCEAF